MDMDPLSCSLERGGTRKIIRGYGHGGFHEQGSPAQIEPHTQDKSLHGRKHERFPYRDKPE
jgi:hypothetical protein